MVKKFLEHEKRHILKLRPYLAECMVLLKNDGSFPLSEPCDVALYGSGARRTIKGGTGSGEVNSHFFRTCEWGIEKAGFNITTKDWLDSYDRVYADAHARFIESLKEKTKQAHTNPAFISMGAVMPEPAYDIPLDGKGDTAVYVLSRVSGEGSDRSFSKGDILLSDTEVRDILRINKEYKRFMLVLNVGGPVDLTPVMEVGNILLLSQLGVETGIALAQVLLGKETPSGKLTTTWAPEAEYSSEGDFGALNETRYAEGIYVGYRYFDTFGKKAAFPFGFGLSYTSFKIGRPELSADADRITVRAEVTNEGAYNGKEVVQLYVSSPSASLDQPFKVLAGFAKTNELLPKEAQTVSITFKMRDLASYDAEKSAYILEAGDYILRIGNNSADSEACGLVRLSSTSVVKKVKNALSVEGITDLKPEKSIYRPKNDLEVIELSPYDIDTLEIEYGKALKTDKATDELLQNLTDEELAELLVGKHSKCNGALSIIGNAGQAVPGAAGETTSSLCGKGIPSLVMTDGPAGIRIAPNCFKDKKGLHPIGPVLPESITELLPKYQNRFLKLFEKKPHKGAEICHQYCTALPIGTAIAQSWNTRFAEICGDIVGAEMELYGIHLWLAPALNIHRDIRCGAILSIFRKIRFCLAFLPRR